MKMEYHGDGGKIQVFDDNSITITGDDDEYNFDDFYELLAALGKAWS